MRHSSPLEIPQLPQTMPLPRSLAEGIHSLSEGAAPAEEFEVVVRRPPGASLGAGLAGLGVASVRPRSLLDRLLAVDGRPVECQEELLEALARARTGPLRLRVLRERGCATEAAAATGPAALPAAVGSAAAAGPTEQLVVLNGEDIGREAAHCPAFEGEAFAWEAVARVVEHYERQGCITQCVCMRETHTRTPPPPDLAQKVLTCPVIDSDLNMAGGGRRSDRIFTLRLAETYGCPWVDNSNYRASAWEGHSSWAWLQCAGAALKIGYVFDSFGQFVPSRNLAAKERL